MNVIAPAIRAVVAGFAGILSLLGVLPDGIAEPLAENAETAVGGILVLWALVAARRAQKEARG